jgi:hypothetical protein
MGNQMFQYAFGLGQAARLNTSLKLDCSALLDRARGKDFVYRDLDLDIFEANPEFGMDPALLRRIYKIKSSALSRTVKKIAARGLTVVKEKHFHVDTSLIENPVDQALYDGWWQSERYFKNVKEQLNEAFQFREEVLPASQEVFNKIKNTNAVCLNVRRTDFLTTPTLNATNLEYFLAAARRMADLVENPHFFVFSDDLAWCQENIRLDHPVEVVTHDHKGKKFGNYLQLMKNCKHFIIPNSSFAWWAVWLNKSKDKQVIAPKNWFNEGDFDTTDLVPDDWVRL